MVFIGYIFLHDIWKSLERQYLRKPCFLIYTHHKISISSNIKKQSNIHTHQPRRYTQHSYDFPAPDHFRQKRYFIPHPSIQWPPSHHPGQDHVRIRKATRGMNTDTAEEASEVFWRGFIAWGVGRSDDLSPKRPEGRGGRGYGDNLTGNLPPRPTDISLVLYYRSSILRWPMFVIFQRIQFVLYKKYFTKIC